MNIQQRIDQSLSIIRQYLANAKAPVTMWSSGKDSQVLLWLVRQVAETSVFFFREQFQEFKFTFANHVIRAWNLDVRSVRPLAVDLVGRGDFLEILNVIVVGENAFLYLPTGVNDSAPQAHWECGCEMLQKPCIDAVQWQWDVAFVGHKDSDVDPLHGNVPLPAESVQLGPVTLVYPLKDWTDEHIWEASRTYFIPQSYHRYDPFDNFRELPDRSQNPDYMDICVKCLQHGESETVICPKVDMPVPRVGKQIDYERRAEEWRGKFVNIQS